MTDPISNERLVGALDNLRVHQRQLDADGCEVGVSREALNEVIRAFGELSRRQSPAGVGSTASCPTCHGTGDHCGNSDFGQCDDCGGNGILTTLALSTIAAQPAGVEPVAYLTVRGDEQRVVLAKFVTPEALNVSNGWAHIPLYASPPKDVAITDEMVERAADELVAHGEFSWNPSDNRRRAAIAARIALTAALSSEAHNG